MPRDYVIHTVSAVDGVGDLVYFFSWLRLYLESKTIQNNKVLIFVRSDIDFNLQLQGLRATDPQHPIFKFINLHNQYLYKVLWLQGSNLFGEHVNIGAFFEDIRPNDSVQVYYISCSYYVLYHNNKPINPATTILELDGEFAEYSLGLADQNLGLLFNVNGITGAENIEPEFRSLSPSLKTHIFGYATIEFKAAQDFLKSTPIIFGYFQRFVNTYVLLAVLRSPLIQEAIAHNTQPLFFITIRSECDEVPNEVATAAEQRKIRLVFLPWINAAEYKAISTIMLNANTNSVILPSGDNSLTACIQAGKFPFYAHKWIKSSGESASFKCSIFTAMQHIMENARTSGIFPDIEGFQDCKQTLADLSTRYVNNASVMQLQYYHPCVFSLFYKKRIEKAKGDFYKERGKALTPAALRYFSNYVAPYIRENYNVATSMRLR
jgi:hypothetical protein